ncbi:terminase, partial [Klebsiella pneumoniae]
HNTEAFAGLHNERKRIIVVFDEASNIADLVWEVAEGALTDEDTEIIWVAFGNPTRNTGRFRECFRKYRHRWKCAQIDSRTVEGTNKQQL